ncbi:MAG: phosphotyrosine protein phosphatase [Candidatus Woesearchaeota archaeon]
MMKLFVCNMGLNRSRTAAELYGGAHAGVYSDVFPVTRDLVEKADGIYVFEKHQREFLEREFPDLMKDKKIINLDIPDFFGYHDPDLIPILEEKLG